MSMEPFHEGERRVQQRVGELQQADRNSPVIAAQIPAGAIPFLREQSLLILAVHDSDATWCLPMIGRPGWMSATRGTLHIDLEQAIVPVDERIQRAAANRQLAGGIVLDFATRRRLRINGRLEMASDKLMVLEVAESYPNCPKYITQRTLVWSDEVQKPPLLKGESLGDEQRDALRRADIFFIATRHPDRGLDASHRGGNPGFIESPTSRTFRFPDYAGNSLFNTLGNLEIDAGVGILLPDFKHGDALAFTGTACVNYENPKETRWMTVTVEKWMKVRLPARETARNLSPLNP